MSQTLLLPAMRQVLARMARLEQQPLHRLTPQQARSRYEAAAGVLEVRAQALERVQDLHLRTRDDHSLKLRLYAPSHARLPGLLYLHGGGFVLGSVATHDALCRRLAHLAQCAVVSVEYRLAPEYRFPTAHNDAWDALQWLHLNAQSLGLDGTRLALGGDSAGGTLAAACAIQARDIGLPILLQLLFYPGTSGWQRSASHQRYAHGFVLEAEHLDYFFSLYLRTPADRADWRFAPLDGHDSRGTLVDLDGVAPAWFGLAECDPVVDDGVLYADRLRMAGVPVGLEIYRGVVHEFIKMGRMLEPARQAHQDAAQALRLAFARAPAG